MPVISLTDAQQLHGQEKHWAYNALDCTGTREVFDTLVERLTPAQKRTYEFELALQAPAMAMMMRGLLVDETERKALAKTLGKELQVAVREMNRSEPLASLWDARELNTGNCPIKRDDGSVRKHKWPRLDDNDPAKVCELCHAPRWVRQDFNPGSHVHKKHLFYDIIGLKPMKNKQKKVSVDDDILTRIGSKYPKHYPLCASIQDAQDLKKQVGWLKAKLRPDGRWGHSVNVGGPWTGRFSSSEDAMGYGGNIQNVTERLRHVFVPDPGYEMGYADLKTAESYAVAMLSGDERYIEAHQKGDPHTYVTRLVWPDEPWWPEAVDRDPTKWTPEQWKLAKKAAKSNRPPWDDKPGHDYRFQSKKQQHGGNYGLTPRGIAMLAHIPVKPAEEAQARYFGGFPRIPAWKRWTIAKVTNIEALINPVGRRVVLFGNPNDTHTHNQGLAFVPQSLVADIINIAVWRSWRYGDPHLVELLAQVHDAILLQWRIERRAEALAFMKEMMTIPVEVTDPYGVTRTLCIEVEMAVGLNWGHYNDDPAQGRLNLNGLKELEL